MAELLPFQDILKVFNNPINEEQAWAVCYQCAHFLSNNPQQEYYQFVLDSGIDSIWLSRHGDVFLRKAPSDPNGSGKGPPAPSPTKPRQGQGHSHGSHMESPCSHTFLSGQKKHVMVTESDAVQALGTVIFQTLDYGLEESEERQLSAGLEHLIMTMTNADNSLDLDHEQSNADDEGIEKDADLDTRCTVSDILKLCIQHVPSKQDAHHHYKAVCRALATEAGELFTFLDKISSGREKLSENTDEDAKRLEELQRADWACLWVQVMRSLRQGVLLKKVEHVTLPTLEYELTPFEVILEDIRSRRYSLQKIMVDGEIPQQVKSDAHAVILNFIRSRPPLKKVDERKLKPKPPRTPDPHEMLLTDIRARPALRPVKQGRLVVQRGGVRQRSDSSGSSCPSDSGGEEESASGTSTTTGTGGGAGLSKVKRVIKPDFNLLLNNSFEESSSEEDQSDVSRGGDSPLSHSPVSNSPLSHSSPIHSSRHSGTSSHSSSRHSWQRSVTRENLLSDSGSKSRQLHRRHTIMICESPTDNTKVATQDLPPLTEEDEPSPVRENHFLSPVPQPRRPPLVRAASDNDLLASVTLRHPQGHSGRRSSADHRRSLTSIPTGLSAIPELEDSHGGAADSPPARPSSAHIQRWSHEQAPPPNPSPPCKGRNVLERSLSMSGMKSKACVSGGPGALSRHQSMKGSSRMNSAPRPAPSRTSSHLSSSSTQPPHASLTSPRLLSTSSLSSSQKPHANTLDRSVSCQSPVFFKKTRALHKQTSSCDSAEPSDASGSPVKHSSDQTERISRWRDPKSREERLGRQRPVARGSHHGSIDEGEEFDNSLPTTPTTPGCVRENIPAARRVSLDDGVRRYTGRASGVTVDGEDVTKAKRRLSLGVKERKSGVTPRRKTSEDERVTRWRSLQEDSLRHRRELQEVPEDSPDARVPSLGSRAWLHSASGSSDDMFTDRRSQRRQLEPQVKRGGLKKAVSMAGNLPNEELDVVHEKIALEEKRFARWRRLEEGGSDEDVSPGAVEDHSQSVTAARVPPTSCLSSTSNSSVMSSSLLPLAKRWQNPVECLSLTLEEVTHIRSVLTKAELESLLSHPDLYQQVAKNKLCFTCKTTRFALFGEWGTKCKFCKRTVCTKCLRKMNVPSDHFRNIPVYTLSPAPLTPQMQEFVETYIKSAPPCSVPVTRDSSPARKSPSPAPPAPAATKSQKSLQRSHSVLLPGQKAGGLSRAASIKGPLLAICCDCRGMVMEIIRASRASLAMLSANNSNSQSSRPLPAMAAT